MITEQDFLDAEDKFHELDDDHLAQTFQSAFQEQPAIFTFLTAYQQSLEDEDNTEYLLELLLTLWFAYKKKYKLRALSIEEVEQIADANEKLMETFVDDENAMMSFATQLTKQHPQSTLIEYIFDKEIGDYFMLEEFRKDPNLSLSDSDNHDLAIITMTTIIFIALLEKARQNLFIA